MQDARLAAWTASGWWHRPSRCCARRALDLSVLSRESEAGDERRRTCATQGWGLPADNGDAVKLLGTHGAISPEVAEPMRRAVGFRNVLVLVLVLVHEYVEVDDSVVIARLMDLADVEAFVREVATFVEVN